MPHIRGHWIRHDHAGLFQGRRAFLNRVHITQALDFLLFGFREYLAALITPALCHRRALEATRPEPEADCAAGPADRVVDERRRVH